MKASQYPNPDVRTLTIVEDMVQMRVSSLVVTVGAFLLAVIAACVARYRGVQHKVHKIQLPSSQLDWIVQAAREHAKTKPETEKPRSRTKSHEFAIRNQDIFFFVSPNFDPCISMDSKPGLSILESLSSGLQTPFEEEDFDPMKRVILFQCCEAEAMEASGLQEKCQNNFQFTGFTGFWKSEKEI